MNFHPLTKEIIDFFEKNTENDFLCNLKSKLDISEIEILNETEENNDVIIVFKNSKVVSLVFTDACAIIELDMCLFITNIYFYYTKSIKDAVEEYMYETNVITNFLNYEESGIDTLFKDILNFLDSYLNGRVIFEYVTFPLTKLARYAKYFELNKEKPFKLNDFGRKYIVKMYNSTKLLNKKMRFVLDDGSLIAKTKKWNDNQNMQKIKKIVC